MTFTKEQIQALSEAELHFDSVCHHDYIRNAPRWLTQKIVEIYDNTVGVKTNLNLSCSACVMRIYKAIGKKYYADKKLLEENERLEDNQKEDATEKRQSVSKRRDADSGAKEKDKKRTVKRKVD